MDFPLDWNELADQPHNVAPRRERFRHHVRRWGSYITLAGSNFYYGVPILCRYARLRASMYKRAADIGQAVAVSVSPAGERDGEVLHLLRETGVREVCVRLPSWEKKNLGGRIKFMELLRKEGFVVVAALLQERNDVLDPASWRNFLEEVFTSCSGLCSHFEVGHAWNRTKWGVWDYDEYMNLALPAFALARRYGVKLIGPAVIDFEFHLYPPTLPVLPFDKITSLLYVDRVGAPENAQAGWTLSSKLALLRAIVDACGRSSCGLWITEVNWPLRGTGGFSPAAGKPNVSEEEQADYLVRYYVLALASGFVEKIFWWQLVAPGYGLVDSRTEPWRLRPSYFAFQTVVRHIAGSQFLGRVSRSPVELFYFRKEGKIFAVSWSKAEPVSFRFRRPLQAVISRDGEKTAFSGETVLLDGSPRYVFFG